MLFQRGKAYSQDLRERVFAAADEGVPVGRIATTLRVSVSYVSKVLSRRRLTGVTTALPQVCHVAPRLGGVMEAIRARVAAKPDATLSELSEWVRSSCGVSVGGTAMWKALNKLGLAFKKSRSGRPNRTARTLPRRGRRGASGSPRLRASGSSSSTKPGPRPT